MIFIKKGLVTLNPPFFQKYIYLFFISKLFFAWVKPLWIILLRFGHLKPFIVYIDIIYKFTCHVGTYGYTISLGLLEGFSGVKNNGVISCVIPFISCFYRV